VWRRVDPRPLNCAQRAVFWAPFLIASLCRPRAQGNLRRGREACGRDRSFSVDGISPRRRPPIRGRQLDQRDGDREGKQHSKPQPDCASGSGQSFHTE
jgi:hypothetical protein